MHTVMCMPVKENGLQKTATLPQPKTEQYNHRGYTTEIIAYSPCIIKRKGNIMHYNITKLIDQYKSEDIGGSELLASDIQTFIEMATTPRTKSTVDMLWDAITNAWDAGYMAGYNKAKKDARKG